MKNTNLLSPPSAMKRPKYNCDISSKPSSAFFLNENSVLSALLRGSVELSYFIENDYHELRPEERVKAFEIICDASFIKKHFIDYRLLKARLNPKKQYRVKIFYMGKENVYECFKFEGKFHTGAQLYLNENYITGVVRIG